MVRAVLYILVSIFAISFIRMVLGIIMKGFGDLLQSEVRPPTRQRPSSQEVPTTGELKPCGKCGTYVLTSTKFKGEIDGKPAYFCSEACQKAFIHA